MVLLAPLVMTCTAALPHVLSASLPVVEKWLLPTPTSMDPAVAF
jgi:hypothetical protein